MSSRLLNPSLEEALKDVEELDLTKYTPNRWEEWLTYFHLYMERICFDSLTDGEKVFAIMSKLGSNGMTIYQQLNGPKKISYDSLISMFNDYFIPTNTRYIFLNIMQRADERFIDFAKKLITFSHACMFESSQESIIRDVFIANMNDKHSMIRDQLRRLGDPTLTEVVRAADSLRLKGSISLPLKDPVLSNNFLDLLEPLTLPSALPPMVQQCSRRQNTKETHSGLTYLPAYYSLPPVKPEEVHLVRVIYLTNNQASVCRVAGDKKRDDFLNQMDKVYRNSDGPCVQPMVLGQYAVYLEQRWCRAEVTKLNPPSAEVWLLDDGYKSTALFKNFRALNSQFVEVEPMAIMVNLSNDQRCCINTIGTLLTMKFIKQNANKEWNVEFVDDPLDLNQGAYHNTGNRDNISKSTNFSLQNSLADHSGGQNQNSKKDQSYRRTKKDTSRQSHNQGATRSGYKVSPDRSNNGNESRFNRDATRPGSRISPNRTINRNNARFNRGATRSGSNVSPDSSSNGNDAGFTRDTTRPGPKKNTKPKIEASGDDLLAPIPLHKFCSVTVVNIADNGEIYVTPTLGDFSKKPTIKARKGATCAALYEGHWHRAVIESLDIKNNVASIRFLELDYCCEARTSDLRTIPYQMVDRQSSQAFPIRIKGGKILKVMQTVYIKLCSPNDRGVWLVELAEDDLDECKRPLEEVRMDRSFEPTGRTESSARSEASCTLPPLSDNETDGLILESFKNDSRINYKELTKFVRRPRLPPIPRGQFTDIIIVYDGAEGTFAATEESVVKIDKISAQIKKIVQTSKPCQSPRLNEMYIAPYLGDSYRAEIISLQEDNRLAEIKFVDFGNVDLVPIEELRELPENITREVNTFQIKIDQKVEYADRLRVQPISQQSNGSWYVEVEP